MEGLEKKEKANWEEDSEEGRGKKENYTQTQPFIVKRMSLLCLPKSPYSMDNSFDSGNKSWASYCLTVLPRISQYFDLLPMIL